jgi:hypothetical protein
MKTIYTLALLLMTLTSYAQNYVGQSLRHVKNTMDSKGYIIEEGWENNIYYVQAKDVDDYKLYLFTDNNICFMYITTNSNYTYDIITYALKRANYWQLTQYEFTDGEYDAKISEDNGKWYIKISYHISE